MAAALAEVVAFLAAGFFTKAGGYRHSRHPPWWCAAFVVAVVVEVVVKVVVAVMVAVVVMPPPLPFGQFCRYLPFAPLQDALNSC